MWIEISFNGPNASTQWMRKGTPNPVVSSTVTNMNIHSDLSGWWWREWERSTTGWRRVSANTSWRSRPSGAQNLSNLSLQTGTRQLIQSSFFLLPIFLFHLSVIPYPWLSWHPQVFFFSTVYGSSHSQFQSIFYFKIFPFCRHLFVPVSCRSLTCLSLKVHKIEIFFCFDFEICIISLLVMSKY